METYGCVANKVDSEIIMASLERAGWKRVDSPEEADVIFVNTCAVKWKTMNKNLARIRKLSAIGKRLIVLGCLVDVAPGRIREIGDFPMFGPRSYAELGRLLGVDIPPRKAGVPKVRLEPYVASVTIAEGCLGACTYCATKFARKHLRSEAPRDVVAEVAQAVREGRLEIRLTSQDCGAYGVDLGISLADLLSEILERVDGDYRIRVGMMNPEHVLRLLDEGLLDVFDDPRIYKFFHVPVQSGNDRILRLMGRNYTADDFREIVRRIRRRFPTATIATDVIVGFPTETWEEFMDTVRLVEETRPAVLNISRYSPMPRTVAARMAGQIPSNEKKRRSRYMTDVHLRVALEENRRLVGQRRRALFVEEGKGANVGRTEEYRPVIAPAPLGAFRWVRIREARSHFLLADLEGEEKYGDEG